MDMDLNTPQQTFEERVAPQKEGEKPEQKEESNADKVLRMLNESSRIPENDIKEGFVAEQEGHVDPKKNRIGFVPMEDGKVIKNSGVTLALGFDVGQHNKQDLKNLGFNQELITKFEPYLGLKKEAAVKKLKEKPVNITKEQEEQINSSVLQRDLDTVRSEMEPEVWEALPKEARTVMVSLVRNFGSPGAVPGTFGALKNGDLKEAIRRLRNKDEWEDRELDDRRNREADLLEEALKKDKGNI